MSNNEIEVFEKVIDTFVKQTGSTDVYEFIKYLKVLHSMKDIIDGLGWNI